MKLDSKYPVLLRTYLVLTFRIFWRCSIQNEHINVIPWYRKLVRNPAKFFSKNPDSGCMLARLDPGDRSRVERLWSTTVLPRYLGTSNKLVYVFVRNWITDAFNWITDAFN
jgi:hypothetical protein